MPTKQTKVALGASVAAALIASGILVANASADESGAAPASAVQAESFVAQLGVRTENTGDVGGGKNAAWLSSGDWMRFDGVRLGSAVTARVASDNAVGGQIELRTGSETGKVVATLEVKKTGGWQKWETVSAPVASPPEGWRPGD